MLLSLTRNLGNIYNWGKERGPARKKKKRGFETHPPKLSSACLKGKVSLSSLPFEKKKDPRSQEGKEKE